MGFSQKETSFAKRVLVAYQKIFPLSKEPISLVSPRNNRAPLPIPSKL